MPHSASFVNSSPAVATGPAPGYADGLARAQPASVGVDSTRLQALLDEVEAAGLEVHGIMLHRQGKVVAEGWRWPYRADRLRILHSAAKSFAACAIGLAVAEGRFALHDKVVSFFPNELPPQVSDKLAAMTVEDLLTMRTGQASETSGAIWRGLSSSWTAEFFKLPVVHQPGTTYVYTSAASYMLSAILQRVSGQTLHDYLRPRLFEPLGIHGETWDIGPDGVNPGGNGLTARTADLLKLGILHAQGGVWEGQRILPEDWVRAATRPQGGPPEARYGYHWAIRPAQAFSAIGVFVQTVIVYPQHGASFALIGAIENSQALFPLVERHFPAAFWDAPLLGAGADAADARLQARLATWAQPRAALGGSSPLPTSMGGRRYAIEANALGVTHVQFDFESGRCLFRLWDAEGEHQITAGMDQWLEQRASMPGRDLHHGYALRGTSVVANAGWRDARTLELTWIFAETAFRDTLLCHFDGDTLRLARSVNINSGLRRLPDLLGRLQAA
jgi:CubicO group peptidase (beta-lactamase class C family)